MALGVGLQGCAGKPLARPSVYVREDKPSAVSPLPIPFSPVMASRSGSSGDAVSTGTIGFSGLSQSQIDPEDRESSYQRALRLLQQRALDRERAEAQARLRALQARRPEFESKVPDLLRPAFEAHANARFPIVNHLTNRVGYPDDGNPDPRLVPNWLPSLRDEVPPLRAELARLSARFSEEEMTALRSALQEFDSLVAQERVNTAIAEDAVLRGAQQRADRMMRRDSRTLTALAPFESLQLESATATSVDRLRIESSAQPMSPWAAQATTSLQPVQARIFARIHSYQLSQKGANATPQFDHWRTPYQIGR